MEGVDTEVEIETKGIYEGCVNDERCETGMFSEYGCLSGSC